jgi:hypothetical protein
MQSVRRVAILDVSKDASRVDASRVDASGVDASGVDGSGVDGSGGDAVIDAARLLLEHVQREGDEKCVVLALRGMVSLDKRAGGNDSIRAGGGAWRGLLRAWSVDPSRSARVRHAALLAHDELEVRTRVVVAAPPEGEGEGEE